METSSIPISCILQNKNNDSYDFPNFYVSNKDNKYYFKELFLSTTNYQWQCQGCDLIPRFKDEA